MKKFYILLDEHNFINVVYTDAPEDGWLECTIETAIMVRQLQSKLYALYEATRRSKSDKRRSKHVDALYKEIYDKMLIELKDEFNRGVD